MEKGLNLNLKLNGNESESSVKDSLLSLCRTTQRGREVSSSEKEEIEALIDTLQLVAFRAEKTRNIRHVLSGEWVLLYTTERELLALMGDAKTQVLQTIDVDGGVLNNFVGFPNGV